MDDFFVFGNDFKNCLAHLTKILEACVRKRLVLSWEKSYFMVREGVVLGHIISDKGLEVDKAKIEVIQNLPLPNTMKDLRSFLRNVGFYRRFIQDFAKVSKPLTTLLCKDKDFIIDEEGKRAFMMLKQALIKAPILQSPNWDLPFEIMCDALDYTVGAVLGQRLDKKPTTICYASKCSDLRLKKLSKSLSKIMNSAEGVESKHSTSWKHQEWMISSSILGDPII